MEPLFADFQSLLAMSKEKAEKNIQEALNYLRLDFRNLGVIIGQYHPLEVLKMAAWEERRVSRTKSRDSFAVASARLLPVLLQSVVQSTDYDVSNGISSNRNIKDKDWQRIKSIADDVTKRLTRSIECYTVMAIKTGKVSEENGLRYRELLFEEAFPPAEDIERVERLSYMTYAAMQSAESVVRETYGTTSEVLVDQMYKVIKRSLEGIDRLSEEASIYKTEVETLLAQKRAADPERIISDEDLVREIIRENGWETRVSRLAGERDDFDLFRPEFAANLPEKTYQTLSVYPGTVDIHAMMLKGLWPATVYPFLHFGDMYFSFVSEHIQSYSLRILQETAGLFLRYTEATSEAIKLLFRETDNVDVYTFDGNKVDVTVMPSLTEVNAFTSPELFQSRIERRKEECGKKPSIGHKALIVEPDDFSELRAIGDDVFTSSAYFLIKASEDAGARKVFYRMIFGQLEIPEPTEYDSIIDPDEIADEEIPDEEVLADDITDEYEYDSEDEEEKERRIEEKEKALEETIPEDSISYERSAEIEKLAEKYELTNDIIKRDEEAEAEADEYERELDEDEFSYDDYPDETETADDIDPEMERIYDEAEKDDEYADDSSADTDQLTFLDELFSDDDLKEAEKIADEEFAEEEEEEYEKAEKEAAAFSETAETVHREDVVEEASEEEECDASLNADAELDEFPCFSTEEDSASEEESTYKAVPDENVPECCAEQDESVAEVTEAEQPQMEFASSENSEEDESEYLAEEAQTERKADSCSGNKSAGNSGDEAVDSVPAADALEAEEVTSSEGGLTVSTDGETTESLIDKGLVKPVELAGGGKVFVMTEREEAVSEEKPESEPEELHLSGILGEIAAKLDADNPFMRFIAAADDEMKEYLGKVIKSSWEKQRTDGKDKMFSIFDYSISVIIANGVVNDSLRRESLLNNAGAVMYSRHKDKWDAIILSINDDFTLIDAFEESVTPESFSSSNWKICRVIGEQLIARGH